MNKNGFTIVEILVVLGSIALILLATISLLMASLSSSGKAESIKEIRQNGEAVLKTARTLLTSSKQVVGCSAVPNPSSTGITFVNGSDSTTIACIINPTDSYIASSSATVPTNTTRLTDKGVTIHKNSDDTYDCYFYCLQPPGGSAIVKVRFTLDLAYQANLPDKEKVSQTFETNVSLLGI